MVGKLLVNCTKLRTYIKPRAKLEKSYINVYNNNNCNIYYNNEYLIQLFRNGCINSKMSQSNHRFL